MKLPTWILLSLVIGFSSCSKNGGEGAQVNGEIFVVTKSRENVKMGLVNVYLIPDEVLTTLGKQIDDLEETAETVALEAQLAGSSELAEVAPDVAEAISGSGAEKFLLGGVARSFEEKLAATASEGSSGVVGAVTDSDGKFSMTVESDRFWLFATSQRSVGEETEVYVWLAPMARENIPSKVLVANDMLIDSFKEFYSLVLSGDPDTVPLPSPQ